MGSRRYNSSRIYLERFVEQAAAAVPPAGRVLDAGAGDGRYRKLFTVGHYESADFCGVDKPYARVDYECDLAAVPVESGRYDVVLLTQVLEHLPDPERVLLEMRRLLRPGGRLFMTAPLYFPEHEAPYDFYRYTQFGLRHLLEKTGFTVASLDWLEGYLGTLAQHVAVVRSTLPVSPSRLGGGVRGLAFALLGANGRVACRILEGGLSRADVRYKVTSVGHPKNYAVVAINSP